MKFRTPLIDLYSRDIPRSLAFYERLGFSETFRYAIQIVQKRDLSR